MASDGGHNKKILAPTNEFHGAEFSLRNQ